MQPVIPPYIESLPPPEVIRTDIGRLFCALQTARKLLKVSERLHKDRLLAPAAGQEGKRAS